MKDWGLAFRDHISLFWKTYVGVAFVVVFSMSFFFFAAVLERPEETSTWLETEALIAEASVTEHSVHSGISMKTRLVATLVLEYEADGRHHENRVFRRWYRKVPTDYQSELAVGRTITIRYDPEAPTLVSLAPIIPD